MHRLGRANFGSPLHRRSVGGLLVTATQYAGEGTLPFHEHDEAYLCLVGAGGYVQRDRGGEADCRSGLLLVHPRGHRHANRFAATGAQCLSIFLSRELADDRAIRSLLGDYRLLRLPETPRLLARVGRELAATDAAAPLALQAAVLELVALACRGEREDRHPGWLAAVLERLHDDPLADLSLAELGKAAGVHPAHLARSFQRAQGMSVGEYRRALRIRRACQALTDDGRPIAEVAAEAGFADQSHFARVFKRMTGETPRNFRRRMQSAS
ncbi:helix-turn-helix transcriptional regulator [Frateuria hangzhouensis]|uniref:helix-turn-helix transcriptional regulator n=1 Tax=Frateuria hangzhouensis TaxID=2995589 RepID=UPI002260E8D0|nr:helix-turn-helix transcriptional regulator [Frateuria sp. STR12]MCX7514911.1 helix-turn-helix transcriptional regulator [Frateuria sp. STR12]